MSTVPITYEIDWEAGLVRTTATGLVTTPQLAGAFEALVAEPRVPHPYRELWDGRTVERFDADVAGIRDLVKLADKDPRRQHGRIAVVTTSDLLYGMARMAQALLAAFSKDIGFGVFRDFDQAMAWLERPETADPDPE